LACIAATPALLLLNPGWEEAGGIGAKGACKRGCKAAAAPPSLRVMEEEPPLKKGMLGRGCWGRCRDTIGCRARAPSSACWLGECGRREGWAWRGREGDCRGREGWNADAG